MTSSKSGCAEAFKMSNFGLEHDDPDLFVTSQWQKRLSCCGVFYVVYRVAVAIFWVAVVILSATRYITNRGLTTDSLRWFVFLTNWGLLVLATDVLIQAVSSVYALTRRRRNQNKTHLVKMTIYLKIEWIFSNIALGQGFVVTVGSGILYFLVSVDIRVTYVNVISHLVNSIYLFVNLFITATPLRVYHILHPFVFGTAYILFSVSLEYTTGISVYEGLEWSDPETASLVALVGCYIGGLALWLGLYGLYRLRLMICEAIPERRVASVSPRLPQSGRNQLLEVAGDEACTGYRTVRKEACMLPKIL